MRHQKKLAPHLFENPLHAPVSIYQTSFSRLFQEQCSHCVCIWQEAANQYFLSIYFDIVIQKHEILNYSLLKISISLSSCCDTICPSNFCRFHIFDKLLTRHQFLLSLNKEKRYFEISLESSFYAFSKIWHIS